MLPTRRHDGIRLKPYKVNNRKYCRSIYYRGSEKWNNLNVNLTLIDDKKVFKGLLLNSGASPGFSEGGVPRSAKQANKPNKRATELKPRTCAHQGSMLRPY